MRVILAVGLLALGLWTVSPANASWQLIPGDTTDRNFHGCGSSWEICNARKAARSSPPVTKANGSVPRFCST
jgi:hypothetical protein